MDEELERQFVDTYGKEPTSIDEYSEKSFHFDADEKVGGTVELPEGSYDLERRQTDFEDGSSAVEYVIDGPEYVSIRASLAPDETFTDTENYEVASTVGDLSKTQVHGLWNNLKSLEEDELMAGFSALD
jgi:hypothetical protein